MLLLITFYYISFYFRWGTFYCINFTTFRSSYMGRVMTLTANFLRAGASQQPLVSSNSASASSKPADPSQKHAEALPELVGNTQSSPNTTGQNDEHEPRQLLQTDVPVGGSLADNSNSAATGPQLSAATDSNPMQRKNQLPVYPTDSTRDGTFRVLDAFLAI